MASPLRIPTILCVVAMLLLLSCSGQTPLKPPAGESPRISQDSDAARLLKSLPPAKDNTVVSVYDFQDQTGQLKPNDNFADYSRAVTQGGVALINKALLQAGNGRWFTVVERGGLKNLLQERQIIQLTRAQYPLKGSAPTSLPPLLYAGMLIEGGVVGYDSNIVTGGAGANYLGVGGDAKYRRDIVTVDLRAVNIANGQVLMSVTSDKTIYSVGLTGNVFKYVSFDHLLQMETGYTLNEPPQLAVRQAIETAVYSLVIEGARKQFWQFADEGAGQAAISAYLRSAEENDSPKTTAGTPVPANAGLDQLQFKPERANSNTEPLSSNVASAEKRGIIGNIATFLSFGDETTPHTSDDAVPMIPETPANYPVVDTHSFRRR